MENFNIHSHLEEYDTIFPESEFRPLIGLTANYEGIDATLHRVYYQQVVKAGGIPILIPPIAERSVIVNTLEHLDGLILTGGGDYNPLWAGEEPVPHLHHINAERDLPELLLTRLSFRRQIPILGICRGIQTLAIALGGKVAQDINSAIQVKHDQDAARTEPTHSVMLVPGSELNKIYGRNQLFVNSFHHQAVKDPGKRFQITARSADGIIEGIESCEYKSILGVQWHPEWLGEEGLKIFQWLVDRADEFHRAKEIHKHILTLDTHCDTPMFFPQGVQFDHRDPRILYDLHKMTEGRTDAVTMVAYLPQPKLGESFSSKIDLEGIVRHNPQFVERYPSLKKETQKTHNGIEVKPRMITPTAYTDLIFDKIEEIVNSRSSYLSIARTPQDLYEDKRNGRKSIMLGIENGLALSHDLSNIKHFAQRGTVYITLCHNGDNDICDSAHGCNTHNGVSPFGVQVIREMNDQGIMVDLSHANEKSFYDALEMSRTPIVCSHTCCRALCDVPRDLTDDQMKALAAKGGVAHITLYHGFLRKEGEATILDAMAHLEHAIKIMGIEHVGLGTDFDGDGTVRGLADASELIHFTIQLLRRKFNEKDIEMIWGGNWLRVMALVQASRR